MKLISEEFVEDENCGLVFKYEFLQSAEKGEGPYILRTELFKEGVKTGEAEEIFNTLEKAVKLYGLAIKTKITPLNLKYIKEDMG
ncbi:MAG: hypothetical protein LUG66_09765 [Clostridiales bacterium]|nr:hypothetical protein [Clostridiales bacterium]